MTTDAASNEATSNEATSADAVGMLSTARAAARWSVALCAWTLFVWTNRIRNVIAEPELVEIDLIAPVVFTIVGLVCGGASIAWMRSKGRAAVPPSWLLRSVSALAVVGSVWWTVRGVSILVGDWSAGFKVVHTILALVTVGLSVMTVRALGSRRYG